MARPHASFSTRHTTPGAIARDHTVVIREIGFGLQTSIARALKYLTRADEPFCAGSLKMPSANSSSATSNRA